MSNPPLDEAPQSMALQQQNDEGKTENGQDRLTLGTHRCAVELSRAEADALLYTLDDADRLFMHHRGDELLALWVRLNHARCYLDGWAGFHGTAEQRSLHLTYHDAVNVWLVLDAEWIGEMPERFRAHLRAIVERCRPSTIASRAADAVDPSRSSPQNILTPSSANV